MLVQVSTNTKVYDLRATFDAIKHQAAMKTYHMEQNRINAQFLMSNIN